MSGSGWDRSGSASPSDHDAEGDDGELVVAVDTSGHLVLSRCFHRRHEPRGHAEEAQVTLCVIPSCRTHADAEPGAMTCAACREHLTRQLGEIETYLSIVTAAPSRSGDFGPHRPGFASTPPARLDVIAMLDPRTELNGFGPDDVLDEVPNVREDLDGWARVLIEETHPGYELPRTTTTPVFLRTNIGLICRQPWVDGFAADITRVHGALARACGDTPAKSYGKCTKAACEGLVYRRSDDPTDGRLRCARCSTTYSGLDLVKLRSADV